MSVASSCVIDDSIPQRGGDKRCDVIEHDALGLLALLDSQQQLNNLIQLLFSGHIRFQLNAPQLCHPLLIV
jgi:hypothetical protein